MDINSFKVVKPSLYADVLDDELVSKILEAKTIKNLLDTAGIAASKCTHIIKDYLYVNFEETEDQDKRKEEILALCIEGFIFIEAMYQKVYDLRTEVDKRPEQIIGSKLMFMNNLVKRNMMGEYPTGSGKSFMYLIYACAAHYILGTKTTVVTSGISLQEQLDHKDLPFIAAVYRTLTGMNLGYGIMKGRGNYICNAKLESMESAVQSNAMIPGVKNQMLLQRYIAEIGKMKINRSFNGDTSNIEAQSDDFIWASLTCKSASVCGCKKCSFKGNGCHFYKARAVVDKAAIVVVNYHILFTEIDKMRELGGLSGGYSGSYVFDEAHEIARIGRDFSEESFSKSSMSHIKGLFTRADEKRFDLMSGDGRLAFLPPVQSDKTEYIIEYLNSTFSQEAHGWFSSRQGNGRFQESTIVIGKEDYLPVDSLMTGLRNLASIISIILSDVAECMGFSAIENLFAMADDESYDDVLDFVTAVQEIQNYCYDCAETLEIFKEDSHRISKNPSLVRWIEDVEGRYVLKAKSAHIHSINSRIFKDNNISTVSVSATLSVNGNFEFYKSETNMDNDTAGFEIVGISPFKLFEQELWYLPPMAQSGSATECPSAVFESSVVGILSEVLELSQGGMLALFTSVSGMRKAYNEISYKFPNLNIYMQGDKGLSNKKLTQIFREDVNSVLFATRSFFTGIDVKGESLRVLFIDKLPFENPSDPVVRSLSKTAADFYNYAVPSMIMTLKQIIGRGVRSTTDKCVVVFGDKRIRTAKYAGIIQTSFKSTGNYSSRVVLIEKVKTFIESMGIESLAPKHTPHIVHWLEEDGDDIPF